MADLGRSWRLALLLPCLALAMIVFWPQADLVSDAAALDQPRFHGIGVIPDHAARELHERRPLSRDPPRLYGVLVDAQAGGKLAGAHIEVRQCSRVSVLQRALQGHLGAAIWRTIVPMEISLPVARQAKAGRIRLS